LSFSKSGNRRHGSLAASQTIDFHKAQVRARRSRTNEKQVTLCLPLRLPLATELLIQ
jgi:hypothetical protein